MGPRGSKPEAGYGKSGKRGSARPPAVTGENGPGAPIDQRLGKPEEKQGRKDQRDDIGNREDAGLQSRMAQYAIAVVVIGRG